MKIGNIVHETIFYQIECALQMYCLCCVFISHALPVPLNQCKNISKNTTFHGISNAHICSVGPIKHKTNVLSIDLARKHFKTIV